MAEKKDKILIADDMETFLRLEKMLLERSGYEIVMARGGGEAIKKIQMEKPRLIFLDLMMPDMNGDTVCRFVKTNKVLKSIPVIIVSTKSDRETISRCQQAGCDDYITKPVTQRDLFEKIKKFIKVERRIYPRAVLRVTATSTGESSTYTDFTYDISEGGIFLESSSPLAVGTRLELEFSLPDELEPVSVRAQVARIIPLGQVPEGRKPGMGIQFLEVTKPDAEKIKRYVQSSPSG